MVQMMTMIDTHEGTARRVSEASPPSGQGAARAGLSAVDVQGWLDRLPEAARATALAASYPRIAERLALFDSEPPFAARYLDQLMIDQRGDRQGFPIEVARELLRLRSHYAERVERAIATGTDRVWGRALHR
ncbi:MAG: hypothetical protein EHM87_08370 [Burkholderiales bacterium]|nr:MAG: hypothetical protein EHM87_08370 [Burkholderiales bacterium]